ncbi:hypothetical protein HK405_001675, partial [Cladochytrium tenue]
ASTPPAHCRRRTTRVCSGARIPAAAVASSRRTGCPAAAAPAPLRRPPQATRRCGQVDGRACVHEGHEGGATVRVQPRRCQGARAAG